MASGDQATPDERLGEVRILFVDDEPHQREIYRRRLERHGYVVETVDNADAAVSRLREERPSVVILDIAMPGRDGLSALQEFLDIDPSVPVIINTAYPGYAENFLSWAADAYIEKSANLDPLLDAIKKAVHRTDH